MSISGKNLLDKIELIYSYFTTKKKPLYFGPYPKFSKFKLK